MDGGLQNKNARAKVVTRYSSLRSLILLCVSLWVIPVSVFASETCDVFYPDAECPAQCGSCKTIEHSINQSMQCTWAGDASCPIGTTQVESFACLIYGQVELVCAEICEQGTDECATCDVGFTGPNCGQCAAGYSGYPNCVQDVIIPPPGATLNVNKNGNGSGTVSSSPGGINCGADCTENYSLGTVVSLNASPAPGSSFSGFSGDADCSNSSVTLDANVSCTATFVLQKSTLNINTNGTGSGTVSSSPSGISCGADCSQDYDYGTVVALNASPAPGSSFAGFSGHSDCSDSSVTLNADVSCTATFTLGAHTLNVNKTGNGSGTVNSTPAGINCGADCTENYGQGTTVALNASPAADSSFSGFTGHADCSDGNVTLNEGINCTATFVLKAHNLSVALAGNGSGSVSSSPGGILCNFDCDEVYKHGTVVALNTNPASGSVFAGFTGHADCSDGTITINEAINCTATFEVEQHTLNVNTSGTGSGTVSSTPAGINCGADCTEDYDKGTVVTFNANPAPGSSFSGFTGHADCADALVIMYSDISCTATFDLNENSLTVNTTGNGSGTVSSTPVGINCGADCTENYNQGTSVTLNANPATGSSFSGFTGNADCSDGNVTLNSNTSCTATFVLKQQTLSVSTTGNGSGTVNSSPGGISCNGDCTEDYNYGTIVALIVSPASGSSFSGFTGHADCADGNITLNADVSCTATFTLGTHGLAVSTIGNGSGTVNSSPAGINCGADCTEDYNLGTVVTLNANPATGSSFVGFSGDADCADGSVTINDFTSCTATFVLKKHTLAVNTTGNGSGTVSSAPGGISCNADCSEGYDHGTVVSLNANPVPGSSFSGFTGHADCTDGNITLNADVSCTATFVLNSLTLGIKTAGTGSGTITSAPGGIDCGPDCTEDYDHGTVVTLSASPSSGSSFSGFSGDADCSDGNVTINTAVSCTATFALNTHTLGVSSAGTGRGKVTSVPAGIDCGANCSETYDYGTVVALSANPSRDSSFSGFSGAGDCADGNVTINAAVICKATFVLDTHTLSVNTTGTGSGTVTSAPGGIDCGADCTEDYDHGTAVTLSADPAPGSSFSGFSGDKYCTGDSIAIKKDVSCTATFVHSTEVFSIGGTVNGLVGSGLVLQNAGGDDLAISKNGNFVFNTAINDGDPYDVRILVQPGGPDEVCRVVNGSGVVAGEDISNVSVSCVEEPVIFKDSF